MGGGPGRAVGAGRAPPPRRPLRPRTVRRAAVLSRAEAAPAPEPPYCDSRDQDEDRSSPVTYIIAQPCVDVLDKSCIEECPVDCIYEGERMLYIHPDECVDCGACE